MDETQERIEELKQIVGKLERNDRSNRRCIWYVFAMAGVALVLIAYKSGRTATVLRAEQFQVMSENGEVVCLFSQDEHGGGLINLLDAHDHTVLSMSSNEAGGVLTLLNHAEQPVAQLESINSAGLFQLRDRHNQVVVSLETGEAGGKVAVMESTGGDHGNQGPGRWTRMGWHGGVRAALAATPSGGVVEVSNASGGFVATLQANLEGHGELIVRDVTGAARFNREVDRQEVSELDRLAHAVAKGNLALVTELLAEAPQKTLSRRDSITGRTFLHDAVVHGHVGIVELILDRGGDVNVRDGQYDVTPLYLAVGKGHANVIKLLLSRDADVNAKNVFPQGETALHAAARRGQLEAARLLIEHGADVNAVNQRNQATPLHEASGWGQREVVELLIDSGAWINATKASNGATPLHSAVHGEHLEIVAFLVERGADVDARDGEGLKPAAWAVLLGRNDIEELLYAKP